MAKKDLKQFLKKVRDLQSMVLSLEKYPHRRNLLEACNDHDQVVKLAKLWGYNIGRRWGE